LAVILESRSWIIVESKIVHPRENSCYSWTELNIDNGKIGSRSRLYQPEAFGPSDPGLGLSTRHNFCFFPFFLSSHPLRGRGRVEKLHSYECNFFATICTGMKFMHHVAQKHIGEYWPVLYGLQKPFVDLFSFSLPPAYPLPLGPTRIYRRGEFFHQIFAQCAPKQIV